MTKKPFESQYSVYFDTLTSHGDSRLGLSSNHTWIHDSSRFAIMLSRYKFVSRMFKDYENVLEIGCGDGFASKIVADQVKNLCLTDIDPLFIESSKQINKSKNITFQQLDYTRDYSKFKYDGIYALDVLEHISLEKEDSFLSNILKSLNTNGSLILGIPSLESQKYASNTSLKGHVNCKSKDDFQKVLKLYFHNVFMFSMNDEVVHTGYAAMSHYLIALATSPKD